MKILVVSLLRLGDVLMNAPALKGLSKKFKNSKIDILINDQFEFVGPLLPEVSNVIGFPRNSLQEKMGTYDVPLLNPYDELKDLVDELQAKEYDLVVNLTHNQLSGWICSLIGCEATLGLKFNSVSQPQFGSQWFQYLNEYGVQLGEDGFHYADIYQFGVGCEIPERMEFLRTEGGKREARKIVGDCKAPIVALQILTSDPKKTWNRDQYLETLKMFGEIHNSVRWLALAAPHESEQLMDFVGRAEAVGVVVEPAVCSLAGALSILDESKLLLTGDTSIKHLASATECSIVELSLGSSDLKKTGAYSENAVIVQVNQDCVPCKHSEDCSRLPQYNCHEKMSPSMIASVMTQAFNKTWNGLEVVAQEYCNQVRFYRPQINTCGFWVGHQIQGSKMAKDLGMKLKMAGLKMMLNSSHNYFLAGYGTEGEKIFDSLSVSQSFGHRQSIFAEVLFGLEDQNQFDENLVARLKFVLRQAIENIGASRHLSRFDSEWSDAKDQSDLFRRLPMNADEQDLMNLNEDEMFIGIRKYQKLIDSAKNLNDIERKLIRSVKTKMMEI